MNVEAFRTEFSEGRRDFAGIDLSGANLSGLILRGIDLRGATLVDCDLYRADFRKDPLSGVPSNLSGARLDRAILKKALMIDADLSGASLAKVEGFAGIFVRANFERADLGGSLLTDADLRACNLQNTNMSKADVSRSVLRSANIDGADFSKATLLATNLLYATGRPSSVAGCQITSGTCELSDWEPSTIRQWLQDGARLERWPMPSDTILETSGANRRRASLYRFLVARFSVKGLREFIFLYWEDEELDMPEGGTTPREFVMAFISAAQRRGLIDEGFFSALTELRPRLKPEIDSIARRWLD